MTEEIYVSVVISTYNPDRDRLSRTIEGLKSQTLSLNDWELIIIDNNSTNNILNTIDFSWHKNSKVAYQREPGLTYARLKGFSEAKSNIIVMVDDDNILRENYLVETLEIFKKSPNLGAIGGKSLPIFESNPPTWLEPFYEKLAIRDLGNQSIIEQWANKYPEFAPIGAGMCIRKKALDSYIDKITLGKGIISDRKGSSLSSSGDNDIVLEILKSGWGTAYYPSLVLHHIIPEKRFSVEYLSRLANDSSISWIQLLECHGISPWNKISKWTVPLRKFKAWFIYNAWLSKVNYIKWRGACGMYDALSSKSLF